MIVAALFAPLLISAALQVAPAIDPAVAARLSLQRGTVVELDLPQARAAFGLLIPRAGGDLPLYLTPTTLRSATCRTFVTDAGLLREVEPPPPQTWRGEAWRADGVVGQVAASIRADGLSAIIRFPDGEQLGIQPEQPGQSADRTHNAPFGRRHVLYDSKDIVPLPGVCGTVAPPGSGKPGDTAAATLAQTRIAEIAVEADLAYFQANGSSVADTQSDVESVLNSVSLIYESDVKITFELSALIVQTQSPDTYSSSDSGKLLSQFRGKWNDDRDNIDRDVAHLMTGKSIASNIIGLAFLGVVCEDSFAYGLVETTFTGNLVARVALSAHEIGHNFDAEHCDGDGDCAIMCAVLGTCPGGLTQFGSAAKGQIQNYKQSVSCLSSYPAVLVPPFLDTFAASNLDPDHWSEYGGTKVSSGAFGEPSGTRAALLSTTKKGIQDILASRPFDVTAMTSPALSFFAQDHGLSTGEALLVQFQNAAGAWQNLTSLSSDGNDDTSFEQVIVGLPVAAQHDCVRFRFRTLGDGKSDSWFVDDVAIVEASINTTDARLCTDALDGAVVEHVLGTAAPADLSLAVVNCGNPLQSLPWTASVTAGSFLTVMPAAGSLTFGEAQDVMTVQFDPTGLTAGLHRGAVRIAHTAITDEFVDLPFTLLVVDDAAFTPGTTLTGTIADASDTDSASFLAVEGTTLVLKATTTNGLKPIVDLTDADGQPIATLKFKDGKEKIAMAQTRLVRLSVSGKNGTTGDFTLETSLKLADSAAQFVDTISPATAGGDVEIIATALFAGRIDVTLAPTEDDVGPFALEWTDAGGAVLNLLPFLTELPTGGLIVRDLPFAAPGAHLLRIGGFIAKEKLTLSLAPTLRPDPLASQTID